MCKGNTYCTLRTCGSRVQTMHCHSRGRSGCFGATGSGQHNYVGCINIYVSIWRHKVLAINSILKSCIHYRYQVNTYIYNVPSARTLYMHMYSTSIYVYVNVYKLHCTCIYHLNVYCTGLTSSLCFSSPFNVFISPRHFLFSPEFLVLTHCT